MSCLTSTSINCYLCFNNAEKLENLHSIADNNIPLIQKFYYCVYKTEWLDTNVPINICIQCRNALDVAYAFKKMCMENSERLRIHISTVLQQENASELIPVSTWEQFKIRMRQDIQSEKFASIPNAFEIGNTQNSKDVPALPSNETVVLIDLTTEPEEQSTSTSASIIMKPVHINDSPNKHEQEENQDLSFWERKIEEIKSLYPEETNTNHPINVNENKTGKRSQIEEPINKEAKRMRIVYEKSKNRNDTVKIHDTNEARSSFEEPVNRSESPQTNESKGPGVQPVVKEAINKQITEMNSLIDLENEHKQTNETVAMKGKPLMNRLENMNNVDFIPEPSAVKMKRKCKECGVIRRNSNFQRLFCLHCAKTRYGQFNCAYCKKYFIDKSDLISHERELHYERKCPYCDLTFFSNNELDCHLKKICNKGKQIQECDVCKKTFQEASALYNHRKTHFFTHSCDVCGAKYQSANSVTKHKMKCRKMIQMKKQSDRKKYTEKNEKKKQCDRKEYTKENEKKEGNTSSLPLTFYI